MLRALNDVVLAYPDVGCDGRDVAVPRRSLAEAWVAYDWPFVEERGPILQGVRSLRGERPRQDVGFRAHLAELRRAYALLTERPDNRLPLDWERNRVDLLIDEGARFACPWTGRPL